MSSARQNYAEECEAAVNLQINIELRAFNAYLSMASWFNQSTVALPGLSAFFHKQSREEHEHALKLIEYQAKRGGCATFPDIAGPANRGEWTSAVECLQTALEMERQVNAALLKLHAIATKHQDPQLSDFIEHDFLGEQVEAIKELADLCTQLERVGKDGLGLYLFDIELGKRAKSS